MPVDFVDLKKRLPKEAGVVQTVIPLKAGPDTGPNFKLYVEQGNTHVGLIRVGVGLLLSLFKIWPGKEAPAYRRTTSKNKTPIARNFKYLWL